MLPFCWIRAFRRRGGIMGSFHRWRNLGMLLKAVKMGRSSQGSGTFLETLCVCLNEGAVRGEQISG